jgi:hypothetical protein
LETSRTDLGATVRTRDDLVTVSHRNPLDRRRDGVVVHRSLSRRAQRAANKMHEPVAIIFAAGGTYTPFSSRIVNAAACTAIAVQSASQYVPPLIA